MAVPRRKTSPSRRGMRRSADALKKPTYAEDKDSGELRRPHHLDLKTGMYKGRQVLKKKESYEHVIVCVIPGCALLGAEPESSTVHYSGFRVRAKWRAPE